MRQHTRPISVIRTRILVVSVKNKVRARRCAAQVKRARPSRAPVWAELRRQKSRSESSEEQTRCSEERDPPVERQRAAFNTFNLFFLFLIHLFFIFYPLRVSESQPSGWRTLFYQTASKKAEKTAAVSERWVLSPPIRVSGVTLPSPRRPSRYATLTA